MTAVGAVDVLAAAGRPSREWAAYVRVSKVMGREGDSFVSPQQQETAVRMALSVKHGVDDLPDARVFVDKDRTGRDGNRPAFEQMLAWVYESPSTRGVCVMDGSRLFRNTAEFLHTVRTLEDLGAAYMSVHEAVESGTPEGTLMHTMLAAMHQFQSDSISRRWRITQRDRVEDGLPSGSGSRFGYEAVEETGPTGKTKRARVQTQHPVYGPVLRGMYEDFVAGRGAQSIAKGLNDRGTPSPKGKEWTITSVLGTLDSGFGAGKVLVGEYETQVVAGDDGKPLMRSGRPVTKRVRVSHRYVDGKQQSVITDEQWQRYLSTRDERRRKPPRHKQPRWHLAGLAKCGLCGSNLLVASYRDARTLVSCAKYKASRSCSGTWMSKSSLDRAVSWWLASRLDELARHAGSAKSRERELTRAESAVEKATARLAKLSRERVGNVRAHSAGDLSDAEFEEAKRLNAADTANANEAVDEARSRVQRLAPTEDVYEALIEFGRTFDAAPVPDTATGVLLPDDPSEQAAAEAALTEQAAAVLDSDEYVAAGRDAAAVYNTLLGKVIERVEVTKDKVVIVPVLGGAYDVPRL